MPAIEFDTAPYRRSHGTEPKGRGGWAFGKGTADPKFDHETIWSPSMTLTEAKKWAKAQIKAEYGDNATGTLFILP